MVASLVITEPQRKLECGVLLVYGSIEGTE